MTKVLLVPGGTMITSHDCLCMVKGTYHRSCRVLNSTPAVWCMSPKTGGTQKRQSWSSRASQGREQPTAPPSQTARLYLKATEGPTSAKVNVFCYGNIQAKVSPSCLRPWRHIWSNLWESSSGAWWRWPPGQAASSWPDARCHHCSARPPLWPHQRSSSAQTWRVTRL